MGDKLHLLVTGASGICRQALVRIALSKGHAVTVIVRDETQAPTGVRTLFIHSVSGAALRLPSDIDSIVHLAQSRRYRDFPGDADEMVRVNVMARMSCFSQLRPAGFALLPCLERYGL